LSVYQHKTLASSVNPIFPFELVLDLQLEEEAYQRLAEFLPDAGAELSDFDPQHTTLTLGQELFQQYFPKVETLIEVLADINVDAIRLNEEQVTSDILNQILSTVQRHERQFAKHQAQDPLERKEGWGAPQLTEMNRYLPRHEQELLHHLFWFQIGEFIKPGVWRINKKRIAELLKQEAEDKWLFLAPSFNFQRVHQIVHRLPDVIDTEQRSNWSVWKQPVAEQDGIHQKAVGVIHESTLRLSEPVPAGSEQPDTEGDKEQAEERTRFIPNVSFDDIGGLDDLIQTVREVIELPLKSPKIFEHMGITPHKGVMLFGPPGCGKTMIAKAIANDIKAHFISIKGPELLNKYYGQSEENLRDIFDEAREMQPSIIFFDEIDAIAQSRSAEETLRMDARIVNQLLTLLDGVEDYGQVCVIAATNRIELIDDALLRPGRFDYNLEIPRPDLDGCKQIFTIATDKMPVDDSVNRSEFSEKLLGLTGADITFVAREGAYNCLRRHVDLKQSLAGVAFEDLDSEIWKITEEDFQRALHKLKKGSTSRKKDNQKSSIFDLP
jgi:ATP-dependent 26S proteasome regulatory subunit